MRRGRIWLKMRRLRKLRMSRLASFIALGLPACSLHPVPLQSAGAFEGRVLTSPAANEYAHRPPGLRPHTRPPKLVSGGHPLILPGRLPKPGHGAEYILLGIVRPA